MSRPRLKNNKLSYAVRVMTVIYLIPVLVLLAVTKTIGFMFNGFYCVLHDFCIKTLDKVNHLFPFNGDNNEQ